MHEFGHSMRDPVDSLQCHTAFTILALDIESLMKDAASPTWGKAVPRCAAN